MREGYSEEPIYNAVCNYPIEGYLTKDKVYPIIEEREDGRLVLIDDNGNEGWFKAERFKKVEPRYLKALESQYPYLTQGVTYVSVEHPEFEHDDYECVVADNGQVRWFRNETFEVVLAPQVAPSFRQMQQIASDVKITCPVVEAAKSRIPDNQVTAAKIGSFTPSQTPEEELKACTRYFEKNYLQPDPNLAEDEWHLVFSDYRNLQNGTASKKAWGGGSNMTSTFVVKSKAAYDKLAAENAELKERVAKLEDITLPGTIQKYGRVHIAKLNMQPGTKLFAHYRGECINDLVTINNSSEPLFKNDHVVQIGIFYSATEFYVQPQFMWIGGINE